MTLEYFVSKDLLKKGITRKTALDENFAIFFRYLLRIWLTNYSVTMIFSEDNKNFVFNLDNHCVNQFYSHIKML